MAEQKRRRSGPPRREQGAPHGGGPLGGSAPAFATSTPPETAAADLLAVNEQLLIASLREHEMAATLTAERAQLATILETMGDAVLVVDAAGRTVLTNAAYTAMLGGTGVVLEDEQGEPLPPEQWPQQRIAREGAFSMQFAVTTTDGRHNWFEANGRPMQGAGAEHSVIVIRDITAPSRQRRLQENFVALASHELRTPLTSMLGHLQLLLRHLRPAPDDERARLHATVALRQARRLAALVQDLLDVTRLETGKLALALGPVDLVPLVAQAVDTAQILATGQTIHVTADSASLVVSGDAGRLEQVLLNLLTNAIAYAPDTARIDVRLRRASGETAIIEVQDGGPGIAEADQARLFARFSQVEGFDHSRHSGLGLGLFICRELVTAHGGTIAVRSTPGEGATFTVRLPLREDGGEAPFTAEALGAPSAGEAQA